MEPILDTALVTPAQIRVSLESLGIVAGQTLIVHSSMKKIGWIIGGARTVVDALLAILGPDGTLVMPAQSGDNSEPSHWMAPPVPSEWWPSIRALTPAFDPQTTPLRRMGKIAECFWHYPGVLRSNHPLDSFIALGPQADFLLSSQPLASGLGKLSPTQKLYDLDARVLLLGVDYANCTVMHLAEYRARSRISVHQGSAILENNQRIWREYPDLALNSDEFLQPGRLLDASGKVRQGQVGLAECRLFKARDAVDETVHWLSHNRHHRILPEEKPAILKLLKAWPVENLFAIGDLETFSLDDDFFDALALYREPKNKTLDSFVIRYRNSLVLSSPREECNLESILSLADHPSIHTISGRASLVEQLKPHRTDLDYRRMFLLTVDQESFSAGQEADQEIPGYGPVEPATLADVPEIVDFLSQIKEFSQLHRDRREDRIRDLSEIMTRGITHYLIQRHQGQIVATTGTTAENSLSAMIVAVATSPDHRGHGLASRLVTKLCQDTLGQRFQNLALFYDNPEAGRIYRRLGFYDAGDWMMATRKN